MTEKPAARLTSMADAFRGTRHVFVKGLELDAVVGVHDHEKREAQQLIVSVDLTVRENPAGQVDRLEEVVCYADVVRRAREICSSGHVNLLETLAERIAQSCLDDERVIAVRVRMEKPNAIPECQSVGIEIERLQAFG